MAIWHTILDKLSGQTIRQSSDEAETSLVYVLIPGAVEPTARGAQFEDAVEAELQLARLGYVSGGGSLLGDEKTDGTRDIIHCGIDVEANDVELVRELLRTHLPELGCPDGTRIHFVSTAGDPLFDSFERQQWSLAKPWTGDDPRFG